MQSSKYRNDAFLLLVLTVAALVRNCLYLNDVHSLYETVWCGHFCNLMRSLGNVSMFHDRSVLRNLIFDLLRAVIRPIVYPLLFKGEIDYPVLIETAVSTAIISVIITLCVPKTIFPKHNVVWAYLNMEFFLMFTDSFI